MIYKYAVLIISVFLSLGCLKQIQAQQMQDLQPNDKTLKKSVNHGPDLIPNPWFVSPRTIFISRYF